MSDDRGDGGKVGQVWQDWDVRARGPKGSVRLLRGQGDGTMTVTEPLCARCGHIEHVHVSMPSDHEFVAPPRAPRRWTAHLDKWGPTPTGAHYAVLQQKQEGFDEVTPVREDRITEQDVEAIAHWLCALAAARWEIAGVRCWSEAGPGEIALWRSLAREALALILGEEAADAG